MSFRVSVALATYNGSKYVEEQLRSISGQTTLPAEVVVSDDGSTDDTIAIITRFAETSPFQIRVLPEHERLGFSDNFFHAASACVNDFVAFCDQDDVWHPEKLEHGIAAFANDNVMLSMHTLTKTDGLLNPIGLHRQGITKSAIIPALELDPFGTGWGNSMIFRKSLLDVYAVKGRPKQPSGDRPLSHDTWIYTLAAALGAVAHIDTPLLFYRQHDLNTMGIKRSPFAEKLSGALTASVGRYREVAEFYRSTHKIFEEIARGPGLFSEAASHAEGAYRSRTNRAQDRLDLYDGVTLGERTSAYRRLHFGNSMRKANIAESSVLSMTKDLLVGIMNIGRRDQRM
jgi:glycosyltransferase involved in cell wall biosynthesis